MSGGRSAVAYGQFAGHYDRLMADMPYGRWLSFARQCWARYGEPGRIVDLGCGTGSVSVPLAQAGKHVTGIDLSDSMLAVAHGKQQQAAAAITAAGGSVVWLQQDMREWEVDQQADAVVSFCDCVNYLLEEQDVRDMLHCTAQGLRTGGLFVFDAHAPGQLEAYAEQQPFHLNEDDIAYIWTCEYDRVRWQIEHELTIFAQHDGTSMFRRFTESHTQRAYAADWLDSELQQSGFEVLARCADFEWRAPDNSSERLFFVARKR